MKPKTIILLVLAGCLLLFVWAFALFLIRGGEVIYPYYYSVRGSGYTPFSNDKDVADEIAKLHFVFHPSKELKVEFQGIGVSTKGVSLSDDGKPVIKNFRVEETMTIEGWVGRSLSSGSNFVSIDEQEFRDTLFKEIQSRITPKAEFELGRGRLWGDEPFQVKTRK